MRYFCVSDVHGFYDEMIEALNKAGFNPEEDTLVSVGDIIDRGRKSRECIEYVMSLPHKILLKGNHEDLLEELLNDARFPGRHDEHNGTLQTIKDLLYLDYIDLSQWYEYMDALKHDELLMSYLKSLEDYHEFNEYVATHGWVPVFSDLPWREASPQDWKDARWDCGFSKWNVYGRVDKTVIIGHWHTSYAHSKFHNNGSEWGDDACFDVFEDDGIVGLDSCTVHSHKVNVYMFEED